MWGNLIDRVNFMILLFSVGTGTDQHLMHVDVIYPGKKKK